MTIALLAAALLVPQPPSDHSGSYDQSAGGLCDGCAQVAVRRPGAQPDLSEAICEAHLTVDLAVLAAETVMIAQGEPDRRTFCPPEGFSDAPDATQQMARAYLAYVDSNPSVRESPDGAAVLSQALAQKWPCPR